MDMWQFFTERARRVMQLARDEAINLGHNVIGTEHILLGLLAEGEGVAAQVLRKMGVDTEEVRAEVARQVGRGDASLSKTADIPLTSKAKRVLDLAVSEARKMGVNYVGTEHILLGLLAEGEGVAAQVLLGLGLNLDAVRQEVKNFLSGASDDYPTQEAASAKGEQRRSKTPMLSQFGVDLTEMAKDGELDPIVGREKEIRRVIQILSRRTKNNPVLIGDPGVGKTAIVEGLAQKIASGDVPEVLKNKRVVQLNIANLVAGTKYRGEFEERMRKLLKELTTSKDTIVFIDEIHTLVGAGAAEGAVDAANILKPSLARGDFQVIGATTLDEYRKHIEKDAALERRFQPVFVEEPSVEDTVEILKGLRDRYESHHRVKITDEAIEAAAKLSARYITDRFLPDKAIDVLDEACAKVRLGTLEEPQEIKRLEAELAKVRKEKEAAVNAQEFEKAAELRDKERQILRELEERKARWVAERGKREPVVTGEHMAMVVSEWTGIPVSHMTEQESEKLLRMEEYIHQRLVDQEEAVSAVCRAIRRARSGLKDPRRPIGSFLFLGPTGVGKTELAKALASFLFGSEDALVRFDMSEFMERHEVSKLIGAPPGYVGYEEGGKLTERIRRRPYSVVLLDEIEKAHPDVFNILLQVMEDGRLTDGQGRTVDFKNTVIIMTSNVGSQEITGGKRVGFAELASSKEFKLDREKLMQEVHRTFKPEFINRLDEIVVFKPLGREELSRIVKLMLADVAKRIAESGIKVEFTPEAEELLMESGFDPKFGARPLRRTIQRMVEDRLADLVLEGTFKEGDSVLVDVESSEEGKRLTFRKKE